MIMRRSLTSILLAPAIAVVTLPVMTMTVLSFCDGRFPAFPWPGWSLRWYGEFMRNGTLHASLVRSALVGLAVAALSSLLGSGSGYWLSRLPDRIGERLVLVFTLPALIPFVLFGFCFLDFARYLGIARTTEAIIVAHVVIFSPLVAGLCYRRLRQLNPDLEDAARELGASEIRIFIQVVGGQIWRTIVASQILIFVLSWDEFIISWFVSGFEKTYPVQVRNMLESTMSPEIDAIGSVIAITSCVLMSIATILMRQR
jgi:spermidine/putrescine transport system permease protein